MADRRVVSVCSGIEAATVAAAGLPWRFVAYSEIDPFASAVLAARHPSTPNVGDFTSADWAPHVGRVDLLVGGTPCQSFSVAGRRLSLDDARGNLTIGFVALADRLDPPVVFWENVPGVLSTDDNAFGSFLGALVGADCAVASPFGRRWPGVGVVAGPRRIVAWRIANAQYFGVPQRRRRVFLVGCATGSGVDPVSVLLEFTRGGGDLEAGGSTGQADPAGAAIGVGVGCGEIAGTVSAKWAKGSGGPAGDECYNLVAAPIASTITRAMGHHGGSSPRGDGSDNLIAFHPTQDPIHGPISHALGHDCAVAVAVAGAGAPVRRLTPVECERLQGFPDDYTAILFRGKPAADGPRYRAIGNSWAVPVARFLFHRLEAALSGDPSIAGGLDWIKGQAAPVLDREAPLMRCSDDKSGNGQRRGVAGRPSLWDVPTL